MVFKKYRERKNFIDIELRETYYKESTFVPFKGTVLLNGLDVAISYTLKEKVIAQNETELLNPDDDVCFGFNYFVQKTEKAKLFNLMQNLWDSYCSKDEQIILYGKWVGHNIKDVIDLSHDKQKAFFIYDCMIYNPKENTNLYVNLSNVIRQLIYNIDNVHHAEDLAFYHVLIDLNNFDLMQDNLNRITTTCEDPVFDKLSYLKSPFLNAVEGTVWTSYDYIFKIQLDHFIFENTRPITVKDLKDADSFVSYFFKKIRVEQIIKKVIVGDDLRITLTNYISDYISQKEHSVLLNTSQTDIFEAVNRKLKEYFKKL